MSENQAPITPQQIINELWSARRTMTLIAGIDLEVFTHIANGSRTAAEVAKAAKANKRGMEHLLDALVGLEYLTKKGDKYALGPVAEAFLVKGREPYIGAFAEESKLNWNAWAHLTNVVKTGKPVVAVDADTDGREFFPKLVSAIFPMSFGAATAVVRQLSNKQRGQIKSILDVAAGSAAWSLPFAQTLPEARVTVLDYEEVTPIARQYAERFGVADRYDYIDGNLRKVNFGRNKYDLVILGHIIHSEGEKWGRKLIQKSAAALKDGGLLLIAEMIPNDTRTGPALPLVFGLNMLIHTEQGDVFTMKQYREWLKEAGFKKISTMNVPSPSPIILATK